jgi:hypothetical protein
MPLSGLICQATSKRRVELKSDSRLKMRFAHIQALDAIGKAKTAEYVWRAAEFIETPLRTALQSQPWFPGNG